MREVTVVIPNYNGEKYLVPCLRALYEYTKTDMEVIVVDNGSKDDSVKFSKEMFPKVSFIELDQNYGFCRAVNEGIKASATPYVLLLNNDTEIKRGFVEHLLGTIKKDSHTFSVEAKMIQYHNQTLIDSAGTFYNALGWAKARGKGQPIDKYNRESETFATCAGAAIYRKKILEEIGLFDEQHFAYLEDVDIGYRARIQGYINRYEPKAQVVHVGSGASGSRYNEFKTKYSSRNNIYLIYKNMPFLQIFLNSPFLLAGFLIKFLFFLQKGFGATYFNGIREGFRMCKRNKKVPYQRKNLPNYTRIQIELWRNLIRKP